MANGMVPLPPDFLNPNVSDEELQRRWAAGAAEGARRLAARVQALEAELAEARDALRQAQEMADDTQAVYEERYGTKIRVRSVDGDFTVTYPPRLEG